MKKFLAVLLVLILCFSLSGVALADWPSLNVTDDNGNPIDWIQFKLHPFNELTDKVDTVWVIPIYDDYIKGQLYTAAQDAYPGATIYELGRINMSGWDTQDGETYIFDYFGPFTAKVENPNVHKGDKVVMFISNGEDENVRQVDASNVKKGSFKFRDRDRNAMEADIVYVIIHTKK